MASYDGPSPIVTDGLVFATDAGNKRCYPSTGTSATDLVFERPLTLTGTSPTYDSNYGGVWSLAGGAYYLTLDNDPALINSAEPFSISCWHWLDDYSPDQYPCWIRLKSNESNGFLIGFSNVASYKVPLFGSNSTWTRGRSEDITTTDPIGVWSQTALTYNGSAPGTLSNFKLYFNGSELTTTTAGAYASTPNTNRIGMGNTASTEWDGFIGPICLYNRVLTGAEITQNYNSQKGRFGL